MTSPAAFPAIKSPIRELERSDSPPYSRGTSESPPYSRGTSPKPRCASTLLDVLNTCLEHMPKGKYLIYFLQLTLEYSSVI